MRKELENPVYQNWLKTKCNGDINHPLNQYIEYIVNSYYVDLNFNGNSFYLSQEVSYDNRYSEEVLNPKDHENKMLEIIENINLKETKTGNDILNLEDVKTELKVELEDYLAEKNYWEESDFTFDCLKELCDGNFRYSENDSKKEKEIIVNLIEYYDLADFKSKDLTLDEKIEEIKEDFLINELVECLNNKDLGIYADYSKYINEVLNNDCNVTIYNVTQHEANLDLSAINQTQENLVELLSNELTQEERDEICKKMDEYAELDKDFSGLYNLFENYGLTTDMLRDNEKYNNFYNNNENFVKEMEYNLNSYLNQGIVGYNLKTDVGTALSILAVRENSGSLHKTHEPLIDDKLIIGKGTEVLLIDPEYGTIGDGEIQLKNDLALPFNEINLRICDTKVGYYLYDIGEIAGFTDDFFENGKLTVDLTPRPLYKDIYQSELADRNNELNDFKILQEKYEKIELSNNEGTIEFYNEMKNRVDTMVEQLENVTLKFDDYELFDYESLDGVYNTLSEMVEPLINKCEIDKEIENIREYVNISEKQNDKLSDIYTSDVDEFQNNFNEKMTEIHNIIKNKKEIVR